RHPAVAARARREPAVPQHLSFLLPQGRLYRRGVRALCPHAGRPLSAGRSRIAGGRGVERPVEGFDPSGGRVPALLVVERDALTLCRGGVALRSVAGQAQLRAAHLLGGPTAGGAHAWIATGRSAAAPLSDPLRGLGREGDFSWARGDPATHASSPSLCALSPRGLRSERHDPRVSRCANPLPTKESGKRARRDESGSAALPVTRRSDAPSHGGSGDTVLTSSRATGVQTGYRHRGNDRAGGHWNRTVCSVSADDYAFCHDPCKRHDSKPCRSTSPARHYARNLEASGHGLPARLGRSPGDAHPSSGRIADGAGVRRDGMDRRQPCPLAILTAARISTAAGGEWPRRLHRGARAFPLQGSGLASRGRAPHVRGHGRQGRALSGVLEVRPAAMRGQPYFAATRVKWKSLEPRFSPPE